MVTFQRCKVRAIDPPRLKVWDSRPEHDSVSRQNPCPAQKQKRRQTFCALPQLGVNNPKPTDKTIVAQPDLRCKSASLTQTKSLGLRLAKAVQLQKQNTHRETLAQEHGLQTGRAQFLCACYKHDDHDLFQYSKVCHLPEATCRYKKT